MINKTYDLAHFHMLLTEFMTRMDSKNVEECKFLDVPNEMLDTPTGYLGTSVHVPSFKWSCSRSN
jgi:hypothetical protein